MVVDGVTAVVSAGNDDLPACNQAPADVAGALTVAATTQTDARRSDSKHGSCVDVFAPGTDIPVATNEFDGGWGYGSQTSFAAPHVAGVAAQYLQVAGPFAAANPAVVAAHIVDTATSGVVTSAGAGSPNKLLYVSPGPANVKLQADTDINDTGIFPDIIRPGYAAAQPGDTITASFVGAGAALTNARNGLADIVVTDSPLLEKDFVNAGYSKEPMGRALFYDDYVIVGPTSDPAHVVSDGGRHDAVVALQLIAARGAGHSDAVFRSRNDASGTNVQEQILWGMTTGVSVIKACNDTPTDTTRKQRARRVARRHRPVT